MTQATDNKDKVYTRLGLMPYVGSASERSKKAETSQVQELGDGIRPTHISHLAIGTNNFEAVADWWQTVLDMKPTLDADGMRFMTFDNEHHKIVVFEFEGLQRREKEGAPEFCGMHHIAFTYASFTDLAATYKRLKKAGILPYRGISHGSSFAIDYYDPDHNGCELQCSCFPGEQGEKVPMNEWLNTGAFNRNPIGVLFDMEEAIAAYERGVDVQEVVSPYRMRIGEHSPAELASGKLTSEREDT